MHAVTVKGQPVTYSGSPARVCAKCILVPDEGDGWPRSLTMGIGKKKLRVTFSQQSRGSECIIGKPRGISSPLSTVNHITVKTMLKDLKSSDCDIEQGSLVGTVCFGHAYSAYKFPWTCSGQVNINGTNKDVDASQYGPPDHIFVQWPDDENDRIFPVVRGGRLICQTSDRPPYSFVTERGEGLPPLSVRITFQDTNRKEIVERDFRGTVSGYGMDILPSKLLCDNVVDPDVSCFILPPYYNREDAHNWTPKESGKCMDFVFFATRNHRQMLHQSIRRGNSTYGFLLQNARKDIFLAAKRTGGPKLIKVFEMDRPHVIISITGSEGSPLQMWEGGVDGTIPPLFMTPSAETVADFYGIFVQLVSKYVIVASWGITNSRSVDLTCPLSNEDDRGATGGKVVILLNYACHVRDKSKGEGASPVYGHVDGSCQSKLPGNSAYRWVVLDYSPLTDLQLVQNADYCAWRQYYCFYKERRDPLRQISLVLPVDRLVWLVYFNEAVNQNEIIMTLNSTDCPYTDTTPTVYKETYMLQSLVDSITNRVYEVATDGEWKVPPRYDVVLSSSLREDPCPCRILIDMACDGSSQDLASYPIDIDKWSCNTRVTCSMDGRENTSTLHDLVLGQLAPTDDAAVSRQSQNRPFTLETEEKQGDNDPLFSELCPPEIIGAVNMTVRIQNSMPLSIIADHWGNVSLDIWYGCGGTEPEEPDETIQCSKLDDICEVELPRESHENICVVPRYGQDVVGHRMLVDGMTGLCHNHILRYSDSVAVCTHDPVCKSSIVLRDGDVQLRCSGHGLLTQVDVISRLSTVSMLFPLTEERQDERAYCDSQNRPVVVGLTRQTRIRCIGNSSVYDLEPSELLELPPENFLMYMKIMTPNSQYNPVTSSGNSRYLNVSCVPGGVFGTIKQMKFSPHSHVFIVMKQKRKPRKDGDKVQFYVNGPPPLVIAKVAPRCVASAHLAACLMDQKNISFPIVTIDLANLAMPFVTDKAYVGCSFINWDMDVNKAHDLTAELEAWRKMRTAITPPMHKETTGMTSPFLYPTVQIQPESAQMVVIIASMVIFVTGLAFVVVVFIVVLVRRRKLLVTSKGS